MDIAGLEQTKGGKMFKMFIYVFKLESTETLS